MGIGRVYRLPFEAEAGQTLTITVTGSDNDVDPIATILDPAGEPVIANDDIELGVQRDVLIEGFVVPQSVTNSLVLSVTRAGSSGTAEVLIGEN